jgi:hypothetical protein
MKFQILIWPNIRMAIIKSAKHCIDVHSVVKIGFQTNEKSAR